MSFRLRLLVVAVGIILDAAQPPSAAAAITRLPTSQKSAVSPVPDRGADPANARSYFGARYYRADIGRFTTIDPVYTWKENLEDPQRWNRYTYVRNNPLRYVDPDGRVPLMLPPDLFGIERAAKALRTRVAQVLGNGMVARITDAALGGVLPVTPEEKIQSLMTSAMPVALAAGVARGGESAAAAFGRRAHTNYGTALGGMADYDMKVVLRSGARPDAVDFGNQVVRELKPDNAGAIAKGWRQVERYRLELERMTGQTWTAIVDTYRSVTK
jgi:RHS repeat-associated protein